MAEKFNNAPLVSVIIPVYNTEKYVDVAVRSIMNQTYKNLEIIITDDCSTDRSFEILEKLAEEDSRIKLFKNETNLKIVKTLNKMIQQATGKYIARMDADDISLPERIEKQVYFLEKNPDYALCGTNAVFINEQSKKTGKTALPVSYEENRFFLQFYSTFFHPAVMLRSEVYKQNLYDEKFLYSEDYELWIRLFFSKNIKGVNLKENLFAYRLFESQTSSVHREEQNLHSAQIFDKYRIVADENIDVHKNLFFLRSKEKKSENELVYAKKLFKVLLSENYKYAFQAIKKLMLTVYKNYPKKTFLYFAVKPKGFLTLIKTVFEKIW